MVSFEVIEHVFDVSSFLDEVNRVWNKWHISFHFHLLGTNMKLHMILLGIRALALRIF